MKISVIIPTWNRAHTLGKAIQSVLAQTVPVWEILVCDDGSTDDSQKLVQGINDKRVFWLAGPHGGLPALPRNRGLSVAQGDWIAFLDSDDEWLPTKLEKQLEALQQTGARALCCNAYRVQSQNQENTELFFFQAISRLTTLDELLGTNPVICSSTLIHRSVLTVAGPFPESPGLKAIEDYALWLRVACLTPFYFIEEPLLSYHDNPEESVRQEDVDPLEQRLRILQDVSQWATRNKRQVPSTARHNIKRALNKALGRPDPEVWLTTKRFVRSLLTRL